MASYLETVAQFDEFHFQLALITLAGRNPELPLELLRDVGWTGAALEFKLEVLERAGRSEVMGAVRGISGLVYDVSSFVDSRAP
jgi:hypothetical protein